MKLIDMKLPKRSKAELEADCMSPISSDNESRWPYGLQICFEKEQIAKMPEVTKLKVGDTVSISGAGKVISVRMSERRGKDDHSVEIQIERVGISTQSNKKLSDMSMSEYNKARNEGRKQ